MSEVEDLLSEDEILRLKELHIDPSGFKATLEGQAAGSFARLIAEFFVENEGRNFVVQTGIVPGFGIFEVVVQRVDKVTPAMKALAYEDVMKTVIHANTLKEAKRLASEILERYAPVTE